jgi:MYXO-CTERM domain-containing protein
VCCNAACNGACVSCLAAAKGSGVDGECGPVAVGTDPNNSCAEEPAASCGTTGVCNGSGACALYAAGVECLASSCASATNEDQADVCSGSGSCNKVETIPCQPGYRCVSGKCLTECTTAATDCAPGYQCNKKHCVSGDSAQCSDDGRESVGTNGTTPCGEYECDVAAGTCLKTCNATADCADGFTCNPSDSKCEKISNGSTDGGCGCRVATGGSGSRLTGLTMLGLLALARRRRRCSGHAEEGGKLS